MRHVTSRMPREAAERVAGRGWAMAWRRMRGRLRSREGSEAKKLPFAERIWMPYHLFTFEVSSRKGPGTLVVSVETWSGAFAIFQLEEFLKDDGRDEGEVLPVRRSPDECAVSAREDLIHTILRQRSRMGGKPTPGAIVAQETVLYPLWIYYYARKPGMIDIKIVDAVSGQMVGHRTRGGVLEAFLAQKETEGTTPAEGNSAGGGPTI